MPFTASSDNKTESSAGESVIARLYELYERQMFGAAFAVTHSASDAEDAVHDAFLNILKKLDSLDLSDEDKTRSLLIISARNSALSALRKNKRYVCDDEAADETEDISAREEFYRLEAPQAKELIKLLPEELRQVLVLRYVLGKSAADTAVILGITVSAVYARIRRARNLIKKYMEEDKDNG